MGVKIIAEAGVNHNGDLDLAVQLVEAAHSAGADIVKFQTFKAANLATSGASQAKYQERNSQQSESQLSMLQRLELSFEEHLVLIERCNALGIEFLSTAFDFESLTFLVDELNLSTLKIPSGELTNAPFVLEHARSGCDLILSTGMATLSEIEAALSVVAFGLVRDPSIPPSKDQFLEAYASKAGREALASKVTLLHCTTEYPAPFDEINLAAMNTMASAFGLTPGYSDHSAGISIPIAATALGAQLIEKHFTLDKALPGPDHKASLAPEELSAMIRGIREVEVAIGSGIKCPTASEIGNIPVARKSLVAAKNIRKGEQFTESNVAIKRPGTGLSPYKYWSVLSTNATRDYEAGDLLED